MSTVLGSQRLESLEVVGNAKTDSLLFENITCTGTSASWAVSGDLSFVSSNGSATLMASDTVTVDSVGADDADTGIVYIQCGQETTTQGDVIIRHGGSSSSAIHVEYDKTDDLIGFFGATPVAQPATITADAASIIAALVSLGIFAV